MFDMEVVMFNGVAEALFLLAFAAPPLVVLACALSLLVKVPVAQPSRVPAHAAPATR